MPRSTRTVDIKEIAGERLRYHVESWTSPQRPHLVDLSEYGGRGSCSCKDWQTRRGPLVKAGCALGAPESMCRHVISARHYFTNSILSQIAEIMKRAGANQ